jgi:hypothetical protein
MPTYIQKTDGPSFLEWQSKVGVYAFRVMLDIIQTSHTMICQWEISIQKLQKKFNTEL